MAVFSMTTGGIFIPLGTGLLVFATLRNLPPISIGVGIAFIVVGFVFWLLSFKDTVEEDRRQRIAQIDFDQKAERRHQEILQLLKVINDNIKSTQSKER